MLTGDHQFVLGLRVGEQTTSALDRSNVRTAMLGLRACISREPCEVGNRFPVANVSSAHFT